MAMKNWANVSPQRKGYNTIAPSIVRETQKQSRNMSEEEIDLVCVLLKEEIERREQRK